MATATATKAPAKKAKKPTAPRGIEPVGLVEIADRLQVERDTADKWRQRGLLPDPKWTVGGRPAWNWPDVWRWARDTERLP